MRRLLRVLWLPLIFAVSAAIGFSRANQTSSVVAADVGAETADERLLIYIGSSTCDFSNTDEIVDVVDAIRARASTSAAEVGRRFVRVGIAKDHVVSAGLNHLAKFGDFDEVMTGRNWANIGLLKYVYEGLRGIAATPQVLLVDRRLINDETGTRVDSEQVLVRASGLVEMRELASGARSIPLGNSVARSADAPAAPSRGQQ